MKQYVELVERIALDGVNRDDRTGVGRRSVFGHQMRFDLAQGFPLLTLKRTPFRLVATELLWMLAGSTDARKLQAVDNHIWDEWANPETGDLGPIYGKQWRTWATGHHERRKDRDGHERWMPATIDQIANVIAEIKANPNSARLVVSAWNVADLPDMALAPCHCLFQFFVANGKLSCQLYQRSADVFLGVPFNIASYALLTHMIAHVCDLDVGEFVWTGGDTHLYLNHGEQMTELLTRPDIHPLPKLHLEPRVRSIDDFTYDDMAVEGYVSYPAIKADVAV